jgi:hypothetical protein
MNTGPSLSGTPTEQTEKTDRGMFMESADLSECDARRRDSTGLERQSPQSTQLPERTPGRLRCIRSLGMFRRGRNPGGPVIRRSQGYRCL